MDSLDAHTVAVYKEQPANAHRSRGSAAATRGPRLMNFSFHSYGKARPAHEEDELQGGPPGLVGLHVQAEEQPSVHRPHGQVLGEQENPLPVLLPDDVRNARRLRASQRVLIPRVNSLWPRRVTGSASPVLPCHSSVARPVRRDAE